VIRIDHLDHLVLTVASIEESCAFYARVLDMEVENFDDGRKALRFGNQKINLHRTEQEFEPKAKIPAPGSADLCFIASTALEDVVAHLVGLAVPVAPVPSTAPAQRPLFAQSISATRRQPD
jgi:catechol 2,3-dioxygenase-like lactoylglutathione lyase family enzyme